VFELLKLRHFFAMTHVKTNLSHCVILHATLKMIANHFILYQRGRP